MLAKLAIGRAETALICYYLDRAKVRPQKEFLMSVQTLPDTVLTRNDVPAEMTWDLSSLFKTDAEWEKTFQSVKERLPQLAAIKGKLVESAHSLLSGYKLRDELGLAASKLYAYANMRLHQDTANGTYQALAQRAQTLSNEFSAASAFFTPEVLAVPQKELDKWVENEPELKLYKFKFDELNRKRPHIRSAEVEEVLAQAEEICQAPDNVYEQFSNADLELPVVADAAGKEIQLTQGNYVARFLQSKDRGERERAFKAMLGTYNKFRNTFGSLYASQVKQDIFSARARHYQSSQQAALDSINVPTSVYDTLIDTVHANLPKLARYLKLRKQLLGVSELHMYDLYVPIVKQVEDKWGWKQAQETVFKALAPLGPDYVSALTKGIGNRWVDVLENKGKRSGAYSWGAYGSNPYMLLNWQGNMDSMFTFAHEAGHSMHSFYTWNNQPYPYGNYSIFVAEVASTCNEALLRHHLLNTLTDKSVRLLVINDALEGFRTTLYRQTLFAEFEREAHARAEAGEALTPDLLCKIFKALNDKYYGTVCTVDQEIENEWMRIPHFYSSFYVYQYATGISAATALAEQIMEEGAPAVKRYLRFLSSGSSDYSINLLRDAGVDLSSPAPIQQALNTFDKYLDEFESALH
jgi:oligoendopeptidase F